MTDVKYGAILQHPGIPEMTVMFIAGWPVNTAGYTSFEATLLTNREYPVNYTLEQWAIGSVLTLWTVESWTLLHE